YEPPIFWPVVVLHGRPPNLLVHSHVVVEEPEHPDPVVYVLLVAVLLHAREQVIEALDPVLDVLVHPLDEVLQLLSVHVVLESGPPASLRIPDSSVGP